MNHHDAINNATLWGGGIGAFLAVTAGIVAGLAPHGDGRRVHDELANFIPGVDKNIDVTGFTTGVNPWIDAGDIARGFLGINTVAGQKLKALIEKWPNLNIRAHSLGNLTAVEATSQAIGFQGTWTAYDSPFFTDLSNAHRAFDGANPYKPFQGGVFVQGFGFRGLLQRQFSTNFGCGHSSHCYGWPRK